jgi:glycerol-3-phosphate acyltransferase PlsY
MNWLLLALAYLLGSIPFGLLLTCAAGLGDVRAIGSGNIGATNVLRTGNKKLALATLALDMAKGFLAVLLVATYAEDPMMIAYGAMAAVLGHVFPAWLRFRGGKGVATCIGALLALSAAVGLSVIALWLAVFYFTRISSLSALIAIGSAPLLTACFASAQAAMIVLLLAALIGWTHRANIGRLLNGEEPRFGAAR